MFHSLDISRTSLNNKYFNRNPHVPYSYTLLAVNFPVNIHPYVVNSYLSYKIGLASLLMAVTSGSCLWLSRQPITGPEIGTRVAELCIAHSVMQRDREGARWEHMSCQEFCNKIYVNFT